MSNVNFRGIEPFIQPEAKVGYYDLPEEFDHNRQNSIETGYFVFTMMPSLRCELNCPHCYLSKEQRTQSPIMTLEQLDEATQKVHDYYKEKKSIPVKFLSFYWYGGEPTQMGLPYMMKAFKMIEQRFRKEEGYHVRHILLTSLVNVDSKWYRFFDEWCGNYFQTSFDGLMRGKKYMRDWEEKVKESVSRGFDVGTITVVNNKILEDTPRKILDYMVELGIKEASFLPMMRNEQNERVHYAKFAPSMDQYSEFMIEFMEYWYELHAKGVDVPIIGQSNYIISRLSTLPDGNIAGQTMFLMPDGDFVLPDYKNGYTEYMRTFGNIFTQDFDSILKSKERRSYLRKQFTGNNNPECMGCPSKHHCIMEFWKDNKENDDCFGAKKYVDWLVERERKNPVITKMNGVMC